MNNLLFYLLEASVLLMILYGCYLVLLRKETFFSFNRFFLMAILVFSLLFPLISYDISDAGSGLINEQISELGKVRNAYYSTFGNWSDLSTNVSAEEKSWLRRFWLQDWSAMRIMMVVLIIVYSAGFIFHILRLFSIYMKIHRMKKWLQLEDRFELKVAKIPSHMAPFSFLNTVFIPDNIREKRAFDQILAHEKTHIKQRHSIDLIFVQLLAAVLWFNPVVWLLIKSLKQTHEYIADKNMFKQGFSLVEYQTLLLSQLISNNSYGLVHNFNLSFIKKRITMMSIKKSGWTGKSKAIVALTFILLIGMTTTQSNALLNAQPSAAIDSSVDEKTSMQFYIDGVPLNEGLEFSEVKNMKGAFKFEINNGKEDNIHIGLDLMRKGQHIARIGSKLQESNSFTINQLLGKAQLDDFIVIDIIDGPAEVDKLFTFPLFRESDQWKKYNDSPPVPVELFVDGTLVEVGSGISLSRLKEPAFKGELTYVLSEFVDFEIMTSQANIVTSSLGRKGETVKSIVTKGIKRKATIPLKDLFEVAEKGDVIMIQIGDPPGMRISSLISLQ